MAYVIRGDRDMCEPSKIAEIVERLSREYQRDNSGALENKLGTITQDYISRGLLKSSLWVNDQLEARLSYARGMVQHILESLEDNRGDIPLADFDDQLMELLDSEYRTIPQTVEADLVTAGLHLPGGAGGHQAKIDAHAEEMRQEIENALTESGRDTPGHITGDHVGYGNITREVGVTHGRPPDTTRLDEWTRRLKNHPFVAVAVIAVIVLSPVLGVFEKIVNILRESRPDGKVAAPEAVSRDPNAILQHGSVVGGVVGPVEKEDERIVFEMLVETSSLETDEPFTYKGRVYRIASIGKRSTMHISKTSGVQSDVLHDVLCEAVGD